MSIIKLLVLDERRRELENLLGFLSLHEFVITKISSMEELFQQIVSLHPSLILLPVSRKSNIHIKLCRELKSRNESKHIFTVLIGNQKEEEVHVNGLEAGADDFIFYTLNQRLIVSRLKALLKRKIQKELKLPEKELIIDKERFIVIWKGAEFNLPRKEFQIMLLLNSQPDKVFSRYEIKNNIWENYDQVKERTIDVHIRKIREKIGNEIISTVKGMGYQAMKN